MKVRWTYVQGTFVEQCQPGWEALDSAASFLGNDGLRHDLRSSLRWVKLLGGDCPIELTIAC